MKVKCPVIEDLLPLYLDSVCSEESRVIVEEHLSECRQCSDKLKLQMGEILIDDNSIKENLKSKEPFKKIKRYQIIRLIVILVSIPLLFLSLIEIGGDGVGFSALYGSYKTERFLSYLEKSDYSKAAKYLGFDGGIYQTIQDKDAAKEQWIANMQKLKDEGIDIVSHRGNNIKTDDGYTSGDVIISIRCQDIVYDFRLFISTNSGRVDPGVLSYNLQYQSTEPSEVQKMLMKKVSEAISTYNPG